MSNSTQCELCGDNKSDKSLYCIYCQAINDIKSNKKQTTDELSVPVHKKKAITALFVISVCILGMLIISSAFDCTYSILSSIKSNLKRIIVAIVIFLLIVVLSKYLIDSRKKQSNTNESSESPETSESSNISGVNEPSSEENIETRDLLEPEEEERDLGEVFHVSEKSYTYNEARAICKKYGADLATPSQVYKMYLKGTSWCNPGWSEGQHVIYPSTQESVNEANSNEETKGSCGKVGLNGMFEKNVSNKFGANCWHNTQEIDSSGI